MRVVDPGKRSCDKMESFSNSSFSLFSRFLWSVCYNFLRLWGARPEVHRPKRTLSYTHMPFIHSSYICCPELMWPLAGVCNCCSETKGGGGGISFVVLIKPGYSSALPCGDHTSDGSTGQRIMVLQKKHWYISWLIKSALRNIWTN